MNITINDFEDKLYDLGYQKMLHDVAAGNTGSFAVINSNLCLRKFVSKDDYDQMMDFIVANDLNYFDDSEEDNGFINMHVIIEY